MGVKAKWQAEGEKSTQYFCNLEKKHQLYQNLSWKINRRSLIQNKSEMNKIISIMNCILVENRV